MRRQRHEWDRSLMSFEDIARELGMSTKAVWTAYQSGLEKLRAMRLQRFAEHADGYRLPQELMRLVR